MKRRLGVIAATLALLMGVAAACVPAPNHNGYKWSQVFGADFDSSADLAKFTTCGDYNFGACTGTYNHGREYYSAGQVGVYDGKALLVTQPGVDPNCTPNWANGCTYKSGQLTTARPGQGDASTYKFKFTRGYAEARIKWPDGPRGFFGAFFLLPANASNGNSMPYELDGSEYATSNPVQNISWMNVHRLDGPGYNVSPDLTNNGDCPSNVDLGKDFHTYGIHWHEGYAAFYIDGVKCGQYNHTTYTGPMYLIITMQADPDVLRAGGPFGNVGIQNPASDVAVTQIDFVHVYQEVPE